MHHENQYSVYQAVNDKITKRITTHTGRHTFATAMIRGGMSLSAIRDSLGHVQVKTTEEYAKLERDIIKREMLRARNRKYYSCKFNLS